MLRPFLTANWRYLAMLNFAVDPKLLDPHVPAGIELDYYNGETYVSVVASCFITRSFLVWLSRATGISKK